MTIAMKHAIILTIIILERNGLIFMDTDDGNCSTVFVNQINLLVKAYLRICCLVRERVFLCFYRI